MRPRETKRQLEPHPQSLKVGQVAIEIWPYSATHRTPQRCPFAILACLGPQSVLFGTNLT
jgi:hypothetical protein